MEHSNRRQPSNTGQGNRTQRQSRETVEFSVKGPIAVSLDEEQVTSHGCSVVELQFQGPSQVGELVFRNYYTAWLTVLVRTAVSGDANATNASSSAASATKDDSAEWQVGIPQRILMPNPHLEPGSHDLFSIPATESLLEWNNLLALRLVLRQPSPVWRTFHVEELNVFRDPPRRGPRPIQKTSTGSSAYIKEVSLTTVIQCQTVESLKWLACNDQREAKEQREGPAQFKDVQKKLTSYIFNMNILHVWAIEITQPMIPAVPN
ncbi:nicolin-1-like [Schistocerca americana]|uniref:nicolin-1-like n=1 Tax=Schistocerca americana TaxID=7009 RepID=UPI001F4F93BD|nr:nicolin-1-like [Schistocerca americana]